MKIGLVTDSCSYLSKNDVTKYNIKVVPLNVIIDGASFKEDEISNNDIFEAMDKKQKVTTSQPSPKLYHDAYQELFDEGYTDIINITLTSALSGTNQSANIAKNMFEDNSKIHVIDTKFAAMGNELLIFEIIKMIEDDVDVMSILEKTKKLMANQKLFLTIDDLGTLVKTGRLSVLQAAFGVLLKVKPVLKLHPTKLAIDKKIRTTKRVFEYLINLMKEDIEASTRHVIRITGINNLEGARLFKAKIKEQIKNANIFISNDIGPVFAVHLGKGGLGVSWTTE